jgi:flagellin
LTFTSEAMGILNVKDYNVGAGTSGLTLGVDTAATGITEGGTVIIEGTTYTFANSATVNTVTGVSSGTIGMQVASQNAIALNLSNAVNNANALNTTDDTATVATNTVTFASVLKGTAGNLATLATGTAVGAGVVAAQGVTATDGAYTAANAYGIISLSSNAAFTVAGTSPAKAGLATAASSFNTLSTVDISSVAGANSAISLIDGALSQINTIRGNMGALQNRFSSVVSSLSASSENLSAARSRIRDADFASETAQLTRNQILQQAGVAMLAQANALPQSVLSLLK